MDIGLVYELFEERAIDFEESEEQDEEPPQELFDRFARG